MHTRSFGVIDGCSEVVVEVEEERGVEAVVEVLVVPSSFAPASSEEDEDPDPQAARAKGNDKERRTASSLFMARGSRAAEVGPHQESPPSASPWPAPREGSTSASPGNGGSGAIGSRDRPSSRRFRPEGRNSSFFGSPLATFTHLLPALAGRTSPVRRRQPRRPPKGWTLGPEPRPPASSRGRLSPR